MLMNVYEDINDELRNQTIQVGNYFKSIIWRLIFGYLVLIRDPILNLWIGPSAASVGHGGPCIPKCFQTKIIIEIKIGIK